VGIGMRMNKEFLIAWVQRSYSLKKLKVEIGRNNDMIETKVFIGYLAMLILSIHSRNF
jgi:hypothetical protein